METTAKSYEYKSNQAAETVEVTVPSGNVFLFKKPSRFSMLFRAGQLPQTAASTAVEKWQANGDIEKGNGIEIQDQAALLTNVMQIRDRVIDLCVAPKLVIGPAKPGEVSTDDVDDEDLEFLFKWVAAGGDTAVMAATFPASQQSSPLAKPNRQVRRATAKQARGVAG